MRWTFLGLALATAGCAKTTETGDTALDTEPPTTTGTDPGWTPSETEEDTEPPVTSPHDGSYAGTLTIELTDAGVTDTCVRDLSVYVDASSKTPVVFLGSCDYEGALAGAELTYNLTGWFPYDPLVSGTALVNYGAMPTNNTNWEGEFIKEGVLEGAFAGSHKDADYDVSWSATFLVTRP